MKLLGRKFTDIGLIVLGVGIFFTIIGRAVSLVFILVALWLSEKA